MSTEFLNVRLDLLEIYVLRIVSICEVLDEGVQCRDGEAYFCEGWLLYFVKRVCEIVFDFNRRDGHGFLPLFRTLSGSHSHSYYNKAFKKVQVYNKIELITNPNNKDPMINTP